MSRSLLGGGERTPRQQARKLLQPLPCWVHLPPRTSTSISYTVHNRWSTRYDYQATCTTRERSSLTSLIGQQSRSERQVCWRCRQAWLQRAPLLRLELLPLFSSSSHGRLRPARDDRRLRLDNCSRPLCQSRHKFLYGGGRAADPLSRLSHCFPIAFVPLNYEVGRRNLLQALGIQLSAYTTLQDKYLTTLLKEFTS
jgi:hypothetical protein